MPESESALSDIRVLDLAGEAGQYCTKLLADLGADVIKIEPPGGDPVRAMPPYYHDNSEASLYWLNLNTSKRSVTVNLDDEGGRALFKRLAATADIIVESFQPGYMAGIGLGYDDLAAIKSDVILTSITGFGQDGPHAHYKAPDIVGVAAGGVMWLAGEPADPPNVPPWRQGYISASIIGAASSLIALFHRDQSGEGQHIDVSMQEALSIAQETAMQTWDLMEALRCQAGSRGIIPFEVPGIGIYECSDGHVFGYVGAPGGAAWSELLAWMAEEGMAEDLTEEPYKEFIDNLNLRFLTTFTEDPAAISQKIQTMGHIAGILRKFTATKTKWEMYEQGQGRRLLWGIVSTPKDLAENPQLKARKWLTSVEHPELKATLDYPGTPYRLSETPWAIHSRPPLVGEHNQQVFGEELGVSESAWHALEAQGAV